MRLYFHALAAFFAMGLVYVLASGMAFDAVRHLIHLAWLSDVIGEFIFFLLLMLVFCGVYRGILSDRIIALLLVAFGFAINTYIVCLDVGRGGGDYYYYPARLACDIAACLLGLKVAQSRHLRGD